mmetsp:Transcript_2235/g.2941  ORF Transcript_2235/g.2941 Transcript_2235/m.2941 type:complete len:81 (-) Transcript_2235:228-470(-)
MVPEALGLCETVLVHCLCASDTVLVHCIDGSVPAAHDGRKWCDPSFGKVYFGNMSAVWHYRWCIWKYSSYGRILLKWIKM